MLSFWFIFFLFVLGFSLILCKKSFFYSLFKEFLKWISPSLSLITSSFSFLPVIVLSSFLLICHYWYFIRCCFVVFGFNLDALRRAYVAKLSSQNNSWNLFFSKVIHRQHQIVLCFTLIIVMFLFFSVFHFIRFGSLNQLLSTDTENFYFIIVCIVACSVLL